LKRSADGGSKLNRESGNKPAVAPANAGAHTPCRRALAPVFAISDNNEHWWLWVPAFAGTTKLFEFRRQVASRMTVIYRPLLEN
jgi:hypothetical protein